LTLWVLLLRVLALRILLLRVLALRVLTRLHLVAGLELAVGFRFASTASHEGTAEGEST
jgi:hypothetical protein